MDGRLLLLLLAASWLSFTQLESILGSSSRSSSTLGVVQLTFPKVEMRGRGYVYTSHPDSKIAASGG
jgi:hypothetical protein